MDRRDFFKTIFAAPLFAPLLVSSKSSPNDEIYLIGDRPEDYLPVLLEELEKRGAWVHKSLFSINAHPQEKALSRALEISGWRPASPFQKSDLTISFRPLQHPMPPSFTLVRDGRIWDVREKKLFSLWKGMNKNHASSVCLTIASLKARHQGNVPGDSVRIFKDGRMVEEISLKKDIVKTFAVKQGRITVKIKQGNVSVPASPCRGKICCSVPPVSFIGERIVCAPNHFFLDIRGAGPVDTIIG